jgi:pyrroline-5-carboxylate reductase
VFLSIAAGITIRRLQELLGSGQAVIRAMPNLPASIGKGISVAITNKQISAGQRTLADRLLKTIGETAWVEDEKLIDAVTALSGSGPAYVFALCEAMAKAGESLGLPKDLAARLARTTVIGSGTLLEQSSETAEALRRAVTSPGGTTEAALKHLLAAGGLQDLMLKAMTTAAERAKDLAQNK